MCMIGNEVVNLCLKWAFTGFELVLTRPAWHYLVSMSGLNAGSALAKLISPDRNKAIISRYR
jgi:hypothetical protein